MSNAMAALLSAVKKTKSNKSYGEDYFYYPDIDNAGNGSAVIRFLPMNNTEDAPFVRIFSHGMKSKTGKWFIQNCPTTLGNECPACEQNSEYYSQMSKDDARKAGLNRKQKFISRILVVSDKKNPEREGKVFLFSYGVKIFGKIEDVLMPQFEDEIPCNVFDLNEGADFKLKIRKLDSQTNYDKSEFSGISKCDVDVFSQFTDENNIQKFIEPKEFKSYDVLKKNLNFVLGVKSDEEVDAEADEEFDSPKSEAKPEKSKRKVVEKSDDDDDIMSLINEM